MGAIGKIFSGHDEDPQLKADRDASRRMAEEEKRRAEQKAASLRSARLSGRVGFSSLLGAGLGGESKNKKSLLG